MEEQIIETARQMFLEYGYKNTNMSDIAQKAGINRTSLHYYYNTKEKMFHAVFGQIIESFLPQIQDLLFKNIPFFSKCEAIIDIYFQIFLSNPSLPQFIIGEINRDLNNITSVAYSIGFENYIDTIIGIINNEVEKGTIKQVPIYYILMTFVSQVTFPFMAKNIIEDILIKDEKTLEDILEGWKAIIITQIKTLLEVK
jgi:AcrR family transcriptional regulator